MIERRKIKGAKQKKMFFHRGKPKIQQKSKVICKIRIVQHERTGQEV